MNVIRYNWQSDSSSSVTFTTQPSINKQLSSYISYFTIRIIGLHSSSRNMNDSQATPATSGTNEDEKSFKETVKEILSEKNDERESVLTFTSNIKELINSNVNKTNERLDKLSAEIADLSASWEFMQKKLTRNYSR